MKTRNTVWMGLALTALVACGDQDEPRLPVVTNSPARAVDQGLLFFDESEPFGYLLDVTQKTPAVKVLDLPEGTKTSFQRPGQKEAGVVLLTGGVAATRGAREEQLEVESYVVVLDAEGEQARYPLGIRFRELALSEDGRYAVAFSPEEGFAFGTSIAVLDLAKPPVDGANPRLITVRSLDGQVPTRFVFSPMVEAAGEKRRFLLALGIDSINLIDLGHLERGQVTIPLTLPTAGDSLLPHDVLFSGDRIFVQSNGALDVLVVQLTETTLAVNRHGFQVSLRSLPVGSELRGIALVDAGDTEQLLALSVEGARMIDTVSGNGTALEVSGGYEKALFFQARSPNDDTTGKRALLYGQTSRMAFLDLDAAAGTINGTVEEVPLTQPVRDALLLQDRNQLVLTHDSDQVSLVDLEQRTVAPLTLGQAVASTWLDVEHARLWITTQDGGLGTLDLKTLIPSRILLDADARQIVSLGDELAVIHPSRSGFVTLFDADKPSLGSARALLGFFWDGILE